MKSLSARNLVSKYQLPDEYSSRMQRSIVSRMQRSVASRMARNITSRSGSVSGSCGCKNMLSELSNGYDWADIFDQTLTIQRPTKVYQLPDLNSELVRILSPGDQIQIYSYVNAGGITWLQFYSPPLMFPDWIPLSGTPASVNSIPTATLDSIFNPKQDIPNLLTTEEKEDLNSSWFDNAGGLVKNALLGIGGLLLLNKILR